MKVLLINNHHQIKGGTERYYFELAKLLRKRGHKIAFFSTKSPDNVRSRWENYFVEKLNFGERRSALLKKLTRVFYSEESRRKISRLLDEFKPDIVHLQNIYYYITPSILGEIKKRRIPIVQTVHDYNLISPSNIFFHNGKICEITKKKSFYKAIFHKCVRDDLFSSVISVASIYSQSFFKFYERNVDCFIFPSFFAKKKFEEYGFSMKRSVCIPNFVERNKIDAGRKSANKQFVLFFGNLLPEKGVDILLKAASNLPDVSFEIAGSGFYEKELRTLQSALKLTNVKFLGFLNKTELDKKIGDAEFCVVPSVWYENMPYSILESFALGKTVIASQIGGIPEIIKSGKNGLLFKPGDSQDLAEKIRLLWRNSKYKNKLAKVALKLYKQRCAPNVYYKRIMDIYSSVIMPLGRE